MVDQIHRSRRASHELTQELGRDPTSEELAEAMDISPRRVQGIMRNAQHPLSLETPLGEEEGGCLADLIEDESAASRLDTAVRNLLRQLLQEP